MEKLGRSEFVVWVQTLRYFLFKNRKNKDMAIIPSCFFQLFLRNYK